MAQLYDKLVRDKIPEIIESDGKRCQIQIEVGKKLHERLRSKLTEETEEFLECDNLEELADILEVVFSLTKSLGYSKGDLFSTYAKKREERGGFDNGVILKRIVNQDCKE